MLEILPCLGPMGLVYKAPESIWFFSLCCVNPLTPKISLVILLTVCCMVLAMLVSRIWYFLFSHHLSASYFIDIVRRISWSLMGVKGLKLLRSCTSVRHTPFTLSLYRWIYPLDLRGWTQTFYGKKGVSKNRMRTSKIVFVINCCTYLNGLSFDSRLSDAGLTVPVLKCLIFHDDISLFEAKTTCEHFPTGPRPHLTSRNFKSDWSRDSFRLVSHGLTHVYHTVYCLSNKSLVSAKSKLLWILDNFSYFPVEIVPILRRHLADGRLLFLFLRQLANRLNVWNVWVKLEDFKIKLFGFALFWSQESFSSKELVLLCFESVTTGRGIVFGGASGGRPFTTKSIMYIQRYLWNTESHLKV